MRKGRDNGFIVMNGVFVGVSLGADYCAEHEWGIEKLHNAWGIPYTDESKPGLLRRTVTKMPTSYTSFLNIKTPLLLCLSYDFDLKTPEGTEKVKEHYTKKHMELHLSKGFKDYPADELATAWSDSDFGIMATAAHKDKLKELDGALRTGNAAMFLGGGQVFQNAGLRIVIASRVPEEGKKLLLDGDLDSFKLKAAAKATGIEDVLKKAAKGYFALSPRWATADDKERTAHPVKYWLNPFQQDQNNFGWFTVEELQQWAENTGPVPKAKVSK